jgi:hypothetical protein
MWLGKNKPNEATVVAGREQQMTRELFFYSFEFLNKYY